MKSKVELYSNKYELNIYVDELSSKEVVDYENYIDVPSFIDYFLINELTKHVDAFKLSFYMHKKKDSNGGKLHMGPIWDFNLAFGNRRLAAHQRVVHMGPEVTWVLRPYGS